jgi:hypothetical protein
MTRTTFVKCSGWMLMVHALLVFSGCSDMGIDPPLAPDGVPAMEPSPATVSFSQTIRPIFASPSVGCIGCHGGTNGLSVGTPADLLRGGLHGPAIIPGNSAQSLLVQKLSASPPFGGQMPLGGTPLPDASIQLIRTWIDQGAKDN